MERTAAKRIAMSLMEQHGLRGWRFAFDRAKQRLGQCRYTTRTISLSGPLTDLNDEATMRDTILHEIAHALTPGDGHGRAWQAACVSIGAKPQRCAVASEVTLPEAPYVLVCPHCGSETPRQRRPRRGYVCRPCWEKHTRGQGPRPERLRVEKR